MGDPIAMLLALQSQEGAMPEGSADAGDYEGANPMDMMLVLQSNADETPVGGAPIPDGGGAIAGTPTVDVDFLAGRRRAEQRGGRRGCSPSRRGLLRVRAGPPKAKARRATASASPLPEDLVVDSGVNGSGTDESTDNVPVGGEDHTVMVGVAHVPDEEDMDAIFAPPAEEA